MDLGSVGNMKRPMRNASTFLLIPGPDGQYFTTANLWTWDQMTRKINMKRIKHNDLSWYFMRPREELPAAYVRSCEKFFKELSSKRQASSSKRQASSNKLDK